MNVRSQPPLPSKDEAAASPLSHFIARTHADLTGETGGAIAGYIPELSKANPKHFGIALATLDGHVYEVGDSAVPFTIQSISKAFVFALALEKLGNDRIEAAIGVEPSGEAFNSIRLRADNRPFNPMVNAGAIACSGLMHEAEGEGAFDSVLAVLGRFAGRELAVDEAVFNSESLTGDRNRAIGYLLHNYGILKGDVDEVLDIYFRQCSVLVTARDLAVMAATLGNGGVNPVTGERVIAPFTVARTLSVMTSSGMYDFAGEWIYRVGIPAKSGVGGGILASLPGQFGLGSFSPLLDEHGNSVRGLRVCEAISARFDLHMLNRTSDVRTCIVADYDFARVSPRGRQPHEQKILHEHENTVRVRTDWRLVFRQCRPDRPPHPCQAAAARADPRFRARADGQQRSRQTAGQSARCVAGRRHHRGRLGHRAWLSDIRRDRRASIQGNPAARLRLAR
jgi:glutaminase